MIARWRLWKAERGGGADEREVSLRLYPAVPRRRRMPDGRWLLPAEIRQEIKDSMITADNLRGEAVTADMLLLPAQTLLDQSPPGVA